MNYKPITKIKQGKRVIIREGWKKERNIGHSQKMVHISEDIRKKLKMAVTTKLEEMGIDVEKELPDYILSIITNHKDHEYMSKNLAVFMGNNSKTFSEWLYNLYEKISAKLEAAQKNGPTKHDSDSFKNYNMRRLEEDKKNRKRRGDDSDMEHQSEIKRIETGSFHKKDNDHKRKDRYHRRSKSPDHRRRERSKERDDYKKTIPMEVDEIAPPKVMSTVTRIIKPCEEFPSLRSKVFVKRHVQITSRNDNRGRSNIFTKALNAARNSNSQQSVMVEIQDRPLLTPGKFTVHVELPVKEDKNIKREQTIENQEANIIKKETAHVVKSLERITISKKDIASPMSNVPLVSFNNTNSPLTKRCRFWPDCLKENCIFVHPTKPCQAFPKCNFGAECHYIHPPCRYTTQCRNELCTYAHDSVAALRKMERILHASHDENRSDSITQRDVPCYFGGRCTSKTCIYQHPEPCRFDGQCTKKLCPFYHGPLKKKESLQGNLYSWRAPA